MNPCEEIDVSGSIFNSYVLSDPSDESNRILTIVRPANNGSFYSVHINSESDPNKFYRFYSGLTNKIIHMEEIDLLIPF